VIELTTETKPKAATIRIVGSVDAVSSPKLEAACDEEIAKGQTILILDFTQVRYISSAGLRSVIVVGKKLNALGGRLIISGLHGMVKEVFHLSGFDSLFKIFDTAEAALASVK
jgi:anti-anti-sigma factor